MWTQGSHTPTEAQRSYAGQVVKQHPWLFRRAFGIHERVGFVLNSAHDTSRKQWV